MQAFFAFFGCLVPIRNYIALKLVTRFVFVVVMFSTYTKLHRSKTLGSVLYLFIVFSTYMKLHRSKTLYQG